MSAVDELSPASFNGFPFFVEDEETGQTRALPVHEYAGTDRWDVENQGLKAYDVRLTAYLAKMEGVRGPSAALFAVLTGSQGMLILPHSPPVMVWCKAVRRSHKRDRLGYVAFSCEFIQVSGAALPLSPLLLPSQAASAFLGLVSSVAGMLGSIVFTALRAADAFASTSSAFGTSLATRAASFSDPDVVEAIAAAAPTFADAGIGPAVAASAVSPASDLETPVDRGQPLADTLSTIVETLRISDDPEAPQLLVDMAASIDAGAVAIAPLRAPVPSATADVIIPVAQAVVAPRATSRILAAQATASFRDASRALALAAFARRLMETDYATRDEAVNARATLSALADPLLDTGELDGPTTTALTLVVGLASGHLIDQLTSLKRVVQVDTGKSLTACLLAWQLYGDTTRAAELVARNGIRTPCFMPTSVAAVAP